MPTVKFVVFLIILFAGVVEVQADVKEAPWWQEGRAGEGGDVAVLRSLNDKRQYRYLQLENKMKVLLVSDPLAEKSAASLNVYVGSFQNPDEREGLAHFLEHMLFLGTEKYPEAGEYQAYISQHGGQHNAYTSLEQTNYFFNVDSTYLVDTLDRFAQFFIAPRFDAEYVDRERHAVESEYRLKIKDDSRREWDVLSELLNPKHPLSKFSVGNLDTLVNSPERPVRADLLAFYQRYYSANLMSLVVLGNEPLDQLEAMVKSRFSAVVNRNTTVAVSGEPLFSRDLPMDVLIKPEQEKRELSLLFPLPSVRQYWHQRPLAFLGHLLGDESEGSFLAAMKAQGLAESLTAGQAFDSREGSAFSVTIGLTPQGVVARQQVLGLFYQWLALVTEQGVEPWRYDELSQLQHNIFRFMEKKSPSSYVQGLSVALHDYPPREVLRGPFLFDDFNPVLIRKLSKFLSPNKALVTWVAPELEVGDTTSQHYGAPYQLLPRGRQSLSSTLANDLHLPAANIFLPSAFPLSKSNGGEEKPVLLENKRVNTQSLKAIGVQKLWYYSDTRFASPRASFIARLAIPVASNCQSRAKTELFISLINDQLDASLYAARLAGLNYGLSRWENGISISISGFAEKQSMMLERILAVMSDPDWNGARFKRIKNQLIREGRNSLKQWPIRQVFAELDPLLRGSCRAIELAEQLGPVSIDEMQAFADSLFNKGHALFYAGGVLDQQTAEAMAATTLTALQLGNEGDASLSYSVAKLKTRGEVLLRKIPVDHSDSGAVLYIQGDNDSLRERAHMAVLKGMMEAPFYSDMRTEKKLGYVVGSGLAHRQRVPGMIFYIQSPVVNAKQLQTEMSQFIADFEPKIVNLSEEDLQRYRRSVLINLEEEPKSLAELSARHWESLKLGYEDFDFRTLLAEQVREVTGASLLNAYRRLLKLGGRALWVTTLKNKLDENALPRGVDHRELKAENPEEYSYKQ